jgi:hypothetical protein
METTRQTELSLQNAYRIAVDEWVNAIRAEEALALAHPSERQVDIWEAAHFKEDDLRNRALEAKKNYEGAVRQNLFDF